MAKASISVTLDTRVLSRAAELTNQTLGEALQTLADEIVADAQSIVPVRTGFLRSTISAQTVNDLEIDVEAAAPYAAAVEYGTTKQPSQPYLTPAVERGRLRLPELVSEALGKLWREAGGR